MKTDNRLFDNLKAGRTSVGCVVTMSDLVVSELAGDCGMDFCWIAAESHMVMRERNHSIGA